MYANSFVYCLQMQVAFMDSLLAPSGQGILIDSPLPPSTAQQPTQVESFGTPKIVFNPDPSNRISLATLHRCVQVRILIALLPSVQYPSHLVYRTSHHHQLHSMSIPSHESSQTSRQIVCLLSYRDSLLHIRACKSYAIYSSSPLRFRQTKVRPRG